jgi:competence protein ComEC
MPYPALRLLVQVALGILIGYAYRQNVEVWFWLALSLTAITLIALALEHYRPSQALHAIWLIGYLVSVPAGFAAYTAALYEILPEETVLKFANEEVIVFAKAETDASTKNRVTQWTASVEKVVLLRTADTLTASGKVRVRQYRRDTSTISLRIGEKFWLQGRFELPKPAMNQGEFDYRAFLAEQEIYLLLVSSEKSVFIKTDQVGVGSFNQKIILPAYRAISASLERLFPSGDERAFIRGMILGERSGISDEVRAAFQKTGTIHVLAISGLHVGLIALTLNIFLKRLKTTKPGKWSALLVYAAVLVCYSNITGNSPPVKRAVLMAILFEVGAILERKSYSLNTLAAAAVLMLAWNPRELFSPSFHLTNSAVAAIILIYPRLSGRYVPERETLLSKILKYFWDAGAMTVAASLGTAPFIAYYFGSVPLLGLLANLVVTDMVSLALMASIPALILDSLGLGIAEYYAVCAYYLIRGAIFVAERFSQIPFVNLQLRITPALIILFFLILATLLTLEQRRWMVRLASASLLLATVLIVQSELEKLPEPAIVFNALGRGSAVIFKTSTESILIDAGVSPKQWNRIEKQVQTVCGGVLTAFVQAHSPPKVAHAIGLNKKMLWGDSVLKLNTIVAYRPARALMKVFSKECNLLIASSAWVLKPSEFFKADVALIRLKKFKQKDAEVFKQWWHYAQPKLTVVELSGALSNFERKRFYRFAQTIPHVKTTERDGQIFFSTVHGYSTLRAQ